MHIPVRSLRSPKLHVKAIVADGTTAYLGSENLSTTSLDSNREVGLITTDAEVIRQMSATFAGDWAQASGM